VFSGYKKLALATVLFWGCAAEDPNTQKYDLFTTSDLTIPDLPAGCSQSSGLSLQLDSHPDPTCNLLQPFRGTAKGVDRVVARGGAGAAQPVKVGSDGRFCIEVMLTPDSLNTITFSPIDQQGCPGTDLVRTIQHHTCASPDAGGSLTNVALGKSVVTESQPKGQNSYLVDGDISTVVEYSGGWGWTDANIWVGIALGQPVQLHKIVVRWRDSTGSGCDFGASYKIAVSAYSDPGKMDLNSGMWSLLQDVSAGNGAEDSFELAPKPLAQHVALLLNQNGCSGWSETFALSEVEVWAADPGAPLPQDRCGN